MTILSDCIVIVVTWYNTHGLINRKLLKHAAIITLMLQDGMLTPLIFWFPSVNVDTSVLLRRNTVFRVRH